MTKKKFIIFIFFLGLISFKSNFVIATETTDHNILYYSNPEIEYLNDKIEENKDKIDNLVSISTIKKTDNAEMIAAIKKFRDLFGFL